MAQDEIKNENQFAFGSMDLTNSPDSIDKPNYISAQNVDFDPQIGTGAFQTVGSGKTVSPFLGNRQLFTPEDPVHQNKKIRLDNLDPSGSAYTIDGVFDQNGHAMIPSGTTTGTFDAMVAFLDTAFATANIVVIKTNFTTNVSVTYEITTIHTSFAVPYIDWSIPASGSLTSTTIQEPIDDSIAKRLQPVRGQETLGKIYTLYAPVFYDPFSWDLTGNSSNEGGLMGLTTLQSHGIIGQEKIHITSTNSTINGDWIAEKVDGFTFKILGLAYAAISPVPAGSIVITKVSTYLEIWRYRESDEVAYRMLSTTKVPVRLKNLVDLNAQPIDSSTDLIKWVDWEDYPRYFEFKNSYVTDGALVINGGIYYYDTLGEESLLILANNATITYTTQLQSGGNLQGASWDYSAWGSVDGTNQIKITGWTGQHPIYAGNDNSTTSIVGVDPLLLQSTGKIDVVQVDNITPGIWKYIYLKGVQYFNGGIVGYSITRVIINETQTSVSIQHTGNENDTQVQDIGTLQYVPPIFKTGRNINTTRNRNVITNLKLKTIPDLSAWALTFKHNICKRRIDAIQNNFDGNGGVTGTAQEFQKILNYDLVGYMINEVQRFGLIARDKKTGEYFFAGFIVDDIKIDAALTNAASINDPTRRNNPNTCPVTADTSPFLDNNLTSSTFPITDVCIPYVQFTDIDWNFQIGNTIVSELIDQIQIVRAETIAEVLGSGLGIPADVAIATGVDNLTGVEAPDTTTFAPFFAFPYISADPINGVSAPAAAVTNITPSVNRKTISIYCSDFYVTGNYPAVDTAADNILINGKILVDDGLFAINAPSPDDSADDNSLNYTSLFDPDLVANDIALSFDIDEHAQVGTGQSIEVAGGDVFTNVVMRTPTNDKWGWVFESLFIRTTAGLPEIDPGANANQIAYAVQYYRALTNKYGNAENTNYIDTQAFCNSGASTVDVFGGDTFTISHYLKFRGNDMLHTYGQEQGFAGGLNIYTQSRVNVQLRATELNSVGGTQYYYPYNATIFQWLTQQTLENFSYNKGYSIFGQTQFQTYRGFDATQEQQQDLITGEVWSLQEVVNSLSRNLRVFPALNIKIEDLQYGGITHHATMNGELVSWQPRMFKRQFFDTNNMLQDVEGSTLVVGDGTVLKQRSVDITQFGCCNKFAIVSGQSAGGDDIKLWPSAYSKTMCRFGRDGLVDISQRANFDGYIKEMVTPYNIANNGIYYNVDNHVYLSVFKTGGLSSLINYDNSLIGNGITSTWDARRKVAIWSARLLQGIIPYDATVHYRMGTFVLFEGVLYLSLVDNIINIIPYDTDNWMKVTTLDFNYQGLATYFTPAGCTAGNYYYYKDVIYLCDNNSPAQTLPTDTAYFTPVSNYITEPLDIISFAWHEKRNGFSAFITPTPKLYIQGSYYYYSFSPRINADGTLPKPYMFQEQVSSAGLLNWYNRNQKPNVTLEDYPLTAKGYIKIVKNSYRQILKEFTNIFVQYRQIGTVLSDEKEAPYKVIVETNYGTGQRTTVSREDWDYDTLARFIFKAFIKNDELTSDGGNNPDSDTSQMYGTWCSLTIIFNDDDNSYPYFGTRLLVTSSGGQLSSVTAKAELMEVITV